MVVMIMNLKIHQTVLVFMASMLMFAACANGDLVEADSTSSETPAMVDGVTTEVKNNHYYAVVMGNYPDPCTSISDVKQNIDGNMIRIVLSTDRPTDLVCAQMITPFTVDLLIETGGLLPGEYTVDVNGINTPFNLGE
jgi:hypothetical protein